jgi:hypothetical protein
MSFDAKKNLKKIISRCGHLAPVVYRVEVPGTLAIKLNFMAIESGSSVEQQIIEAIENQCYPLLVE